jgi:glycosyltransferase involved in cell wall biosynthesis
MTMARATVVHVITQLELGGAQEIAMLFCRHLAQRGFDVHLVAGRGGILDDEAIAIPAVSFHHDDNLVRAIDPPHDLRCLRSLARRLADLRRRSGAPMIVHTHSSKAGVLGRWAAWMAGAEIRVHSIHGFGFHGGLPWATRAAFRAAERVTAPITHAFCPASEANRRVAERLGLLAAGQPAVVLPEAIDASQYEPEPQDAAAVRVELGLAPETPLVGMIACFKPQKAPLDFVRASAKVAAAHASAHFFAAGDGVLRAEVEAKIRALGLGQRVHLLGWRRDVRRLLGAADVLVLTSLWEGLPRVVLQAMAASKPVVATRVDGTPEAVADGESGFLLEPHDVEGFADRIRRLLDDPALAERMGREGRRRLRPFLAPLMLEKLDRLYDDLLARRA